MASMKSAITTLSRSLRAARSAASLTTLARSAPAKPGVRVATARRTDADEHLDELGAGEREEGHAGLARDRAREKSLAGSGRTDEQDTLRDAAAQATELRRRLEELDDLLQLVDRLVDPGDVLEGNAGGRLHVDARF